jgi:hypothetical protein
MAPALPVCSSANAAIIQRHAAPGRVGLSGGRDGINTLIRKAQAPLASGGHRRFRSHAFLFMEQRIDGHWRGLEPDLDLRCQQIRLAHGRRPSVTTAR